MLDNIIFGAVTSAVLLCALMTIFTKESVKSALWLACAFFSSSILWMSLQAEFLGLILILVYVGAIVTLFLFVIMTFSDEILIKPNVSNMMLTRIVPTGLAGIWCTLTAPILYFFFKGFLRKETVYLSDKMSNTHLLGNQLYTQYAYPVELVGILLLSAIVVSISLTVDKQTDIDKTFSDQWRFIDRKSRIILVKEDTEQ